MAEATVPQIQRFANERVRVRAEEFRTLVLAMRDDKNALDDVYEALTGSQSTWTDSRTDGPPHLLAANDILSYNSFATALLAAVDGGRTDQQRTDLPGLSTTLLGACVRSV